jgi:hypothetical protein
MLSSDPEIRRLAELVAVSTVEYNDEREPAAERLGFFVGTLDWLVSKAAKNYGAAETIPPPDPEIAPHEDAKAAEAKGRARGAKHPGGRPPKWIGVKGVTPDAEAFFRLIDAARKSGAESVRGAIREVYDQIPSSQKISSFGKKLDIQTLENRFFNLRAKLASKSGATA